MSDLTRRAVCQSLPLLALFSAISAEGQAPVKKSCVEPVLDTCLAFPFETLPIRYSDAGAPTREILEGRIPGSQVIEIHETQLAAGKMPHPAHRHAHAELLLVRMGTIEFQSEGKPVRVTAGGAAYCAPNQLHGFRNVGDTDAMYFVVKVGAEPVCQK